MIAASCFGDIVSGTGAKTPRMIWRTRHENIRVQGGVMCLVAFLDWYSRCVVSWGLSGALEDGLVISALNSALKTAVPDIANSDQGSQVAGNGYIGILLENGVDISKDGRGLFMDNIFTERLWQTLKHGGIYIKEYATPMEPRSGLGACFNKYNIRRGHQSFDYKTPEDAYYEQSVLFQDIKPENPSPWEQQ